MLQGEEDVLFPSNSSDPLLSKVAIYSSWHYHEAAPVAQSTPQVSNDEVEKSRLQHRLVELEAELKNPTRSIDDILDEVKQTKSELRRFRRWLW